MEVLLQIHDRTIPVVPDLLVVMRGVRDRFAAQNLGMHADNQDLLIIGSVENADLSSLRQIAAGVATESRVQFLGAGMFEAKDLAALWVDSGHDVLDCAVFSRRSIA